MRQLKITQSLTLRSDTIDGYLRDINCLERVSPEEEAELASRVQQGDEEAFRRLVEANLRFVVSVAKQYQGAGLDLCDLINEGNLGLMTAVRKFDPSKGFKLISYSVWWIRQAILAAISEQGRMVRLPLNKVGEQNKIRKAMSEFIQKEHRDPSNDELSSETGIRSDKVSESILNMQRHESLDRNIGDDSDASTMIEVIPDKLSEETDASVMRESLYADILSALDILTQREAEIIQQSFGIGCRELTLEEIGENMNLTRERVRQIREKAIRKLARPAVKEKLRQYL